ncbi:hypothetical protein LCGC14_1321010 [marine sediment metagenome]|uniref:Uncharacterized protein n=1 Tax=marine sediment metagenome TaxID=412755 RepID=A0A0F9N0B5_9ZZZZ
MSSRYTKEHYEDVARILKVQVSSTAPLNWVGHIAEVETNATVKRIAYRFADLFAADNPPVCIHCRQSPVSSGLCLGGQQQYLNHEVKGGFDRKWFLAACGLEPEQHTVPKQVLEHYGLSKIDQDRRG